MADERDPKVSARYRELGAEEPPRALDEAILAASRRAVSDEMRARPAPLLAPAGRRRWYFPVAAAAIITLAVAVTVQVERQKPDEEFVAAQAPAPKPAEQKAELPLKEERVLKSEPAKAKPAAPPARSKGFTPDPPQATAPQASADSVRELAKTNEAEAAANAARSRESASGAGARLEQRSGAAPAAPQATPAPAASAARRDASAASVSAARAPQVRVNPERWLEQIVELRKEGLHDDADKLLEEFRRSYPGYKLSDEMRAKVERR